MTTRNAKGLLALAGFFLVSLGAGCYSPPAGLIAAGLLLLAEANTGPTHTPDKES